MNNQLADWENNSLIKWRTAWLLVELSGGRTRRLYRTKSRAASGQLDWAVPISLLQHAVYPLHPF